MSQNTGLFFTICNLYSTKKCCRWIFIAPSFSSNLRNFTLRALSFVSEGSVLVFTEKQLLIWGCLSTCAGTVWGQTPYLGLFTPLLLTRSTTPGGIFCLKWAFIREFTGISVTSKKCAHGVKKSSFRSQLEEIWPKGLVVIWSLFVYFVSVPKSRCWRENSEERKDIFLYSHCLQSRMA